MECHHGTQSSRWWPLWGCLITQKERRNEGMGTMTWAILWDGWRALTGANLMSSPGTGWRTPSHGPSLWGTWLLGTFHRKDTLFIHRPETLQFLCWLFTLESRLRATSNGILLWYFVSPTQGDNPFPKHIGPRRGDSSLADLNYHVSSPAITVVLLSSISTSAKRLKIPICTTCSGWTGCII